MQSADSVVPVGDLEHVLDLAGIALLIFDTAGTVLAANGVAVAMFGHSRDALLGRDVGTLIPPRYSTHRNDWLRGQGSFQAGTAMGKGRMTQALRSDGRVFPIHLTLGVSASGTERRLVAIIHDLTEFRHSQEAAARLGAIVNGSFNEVYVFAADTLRFTTVNQSAATSLGYTQNELLHMTPLDVKPLFDRQSYERLLAPLRDGSAEHVSFQTVQQRKDGSCYDVEVVLRFSDAVMPREFIAIMQDVSEREQLQRQFMQAQKMESLGQLTGGIAHDFNNLLTVIGGNLEMLDMYADASLDQELIDEARNAVGKGAELTSRMLAFARRRELTPETIDLNDRVIGLMNLLRRGLGDAVALKLKLSPDLWPTRVDPTLLESALMNLVINARDAIDAHGNLTLETANASLDRATAAVHELVPGDYVKLSVQDDGAGIDPALLDKVFDPFFTTKQPGNRSGLGLSMVYGFSRQSGGAVSVQSVVGEGSAFTVWLPRCRSSDASAPVRTNRSVPHSAAGSCILLVEDDEHVRRTTARQLEHIGNRVIEAENAESALRVYASYPEIDVLFSDMVMPGELTGLELARTLRWISPGLAVIIASGSSEQLASADRPVRDGFVVLEKPFDQNALIDALHEARAVARESKNKTIQNTAAQ